MPEHSPAPSKAEAADAAVKAAAAEDEQTSTDDAAAAPATVHPFARYVAGLFGPMSQCDQKWVNGVMNWLLLSAAVVGYVGGWYLNSFAITTYVVLAATAVCIVVCTPNWRQRPDADAGTWIESAAAADYYERLNTLEVAIAKADGGRKAVHHHM